MEGALHWFYSAGHLTKLQFPSVMNRFVHQRSLGLNSLFRLLANVFEMLRHVKCLKCFRVHSAELWAGGAVCLLAGVCAVWQVPRSSGCRIKILAAHCWHCMHTRNGLINSACVKKAGRWVWTHWQSTLTVCLLRTAQHAPCPLWSCFILWLYQYILVK